LARRGRIEWLKRHRNPLAWMVNVPTRRGLVKLVTAPGEIASIARDRPTFNLFGCEARVGGIQVRNADRRVNR
jgi:hypothetical protein